MARKAIGRNDPCPCGSGKKWKKCHLLKAREIEADIRAGAQYVKGNGLFGLVKIKDAPSAEAELIENADSGEVSGARETASV